MSIDFQEDFLEKIVNVNWGGGSTKFPDGSLVEQGVSPVANSSVLSMSMAFRIVGGSDAYTLIVMGHDDPETLRFGEQPGFSVGINRNPVDDTFDMVVALCGVLDTMLIPDNLVFISGHEEEINPIYSENAHLYTPLALAHYSDVGSFVGGEKVVHLGVSIDTSVASQGGDDGSFESGFKLECLLNGTALTAAPSLTPSVGGYPPDRLWAFAQPFDAGIIPAAVTPLVVDNQATPPTKWRVNIPSFQMGFTGFPFAVPVDSASSGGLGDIVVDKVQVWTNQYISMRSNIRKFLAPNGQLQATTIAQKAFGKSQYLLEGPPTKFGKNKGTAGGVNTTGTPEKVKTLTRVGK